MASAASRADLGALLGVERRRGRLLHHLLMAALQRAVALAQMHDVAVPVGQDLDLDMARDGRGISPYRPRRCRNAPSPRCGRGSPACGSSARRVGDLHALAAAAGRRLDQHRKADLRRPGRAPPHRFTAPSEPGTTGMPSDFAVSFACTLSPITAMCSGRGPMKVKPCSSTIAANCAFSERKPMPGWIASAPVMARGRDDRRDVEIAFARGRRADAHALVGEAHMHGVGIGGRMHRDGADAHLAAGAMDPERDLAAVGDQHFFEHAGPAPAGSLQGPIRSPGAAGRTRPACRRRRGSA